MENVEVLIIGAGVVGLAIARAFSLDGREVIVAEKEEMAGSGTSARNSGVIHAGIYYPKNSNKARFCVEGNRALYAYAKERQISYNNCGKIIVACIEEERTKLENIQQRALKNGVSDLKVISQDEIQELEPNVKSCGGLISPSTGIIDIHGLMQEFIVDIEENNGVLAYDNAIDKINIRDDGFEVFLEGDIPPILTKTLINAAGLGAQAVAQRMVGLNPATIPQQYLAKGNYFGISGAAPFSRLIYPVPVDGGLGAHFTMNIAGESVFGPDVEWLSSDDPAGIPPYDYRVDERRVDTFYQSVARFWPDVKDKELVPAYSGIRPKVSGPGENAGDFVLQDKSVHGIEGLVNLYGIESPGLTSSMALAQAVRQSFL